MRPCDIFFQQGPIKSCPWIFFATGCNVLVTRDMRNGVLLAQGLDEQAYADVLRIFKCVSL